MSGFTVIDGVTRTLAGFLEAQTGIQVNFLESPVGDLNDNQSLIHLYLYRVEVNPFFTNSDFVSPSPSELRDPPIGLNLLYLITPYGTNESQIQLTLGEIIKVLHEHSIIPPSAFHASLADTTEELRVLPRALPLQEMTEFWRAFEQRSYRLSMTYEASAVLIDSDVSRTVSRVEERFVTVRTMS